MKCVVTGGSGFIGSHVIDALKAKSHHVINVDAREANVPSDKYINVDIRDSDKLKEVFSRDGTDTVFHIAAIANARAALERPIDAVDINIKGTTSVLEAARLADVKRVILASTVWVFNAVNQDSKPGKTRYLNEQESFLPDGGGHIYTTSKIASEFICHDYQKLYGLDFTILRYGIPYGPRMWSGLALQSFVENSFSGNPIKIFGDGSAVRRFLYVGDLAKAHVLALSEKAKNQTYNLEGKRDVTIKELAETVAKFIEGVKIEYLIDPSRKGELKLGSVVISNQKAKEELGWEPTVRLTEGVRRTVEWYRKEILGEKI